MKYGIRNQWGDTRLEDLDVESGRKGVQSMLVPHRLRGSISVCWSILLIMLVTAGCRNSPPPVETLVFPAIIEKVESTTLTVIPEEEVGFPKAVVHLADSVSLTFFPLPGQRITVEIVPEIRESEPVQVTAVNITLEALPTPQSCQTLSVEEAESLIRARSHIFIDARSASEFEMGHVEGAIRLTVEEVEGGLPEILQDREQVVLVYCASGVRSRNLCRRLAEMGVQHVFDLGGRNDWPRDPRP